jgi:thioredoxin 1
MADHNGSASRRKDTMASENVQELTDANFDAVVGGTEHPVLVDFWAEWCGPCRMLAPTIQALADELQDKAVIAKLNVDENPTVPGTYGIRSIPALLVFKGGQLVDQTVGVQSKDALKRLLERHI